MLFFLAGVCAGSVCGLLGAGGGMLLVPMLSRKLPPDQVFPASVSVMLPVTAVSLLLSAWEPEAASRILPCMLGSAAGGLIAGLWGEKIPTKWLHRFLGVLILWGGVRMLCF